NVNAAHLIQVVADELQRLRHRAAPLCGPTTNRHEFRELVDGEPFTLAGRWPGVQQRAQRGSAGGGAELEETHRSHLKPREASGTSVSSDVVRRHGRAGEDELAGLLPVVDCAPNMIPDRWLDLPLVYEARHGPIEDY